MSKFKVSIVGLGRIAEHYLNILNSKSFNNINISSVCDKKKNKLNKFLKKYKRIPVFSNLNNLLIIDKPDLLIIATPSGIHYENAKLALNKGCNVLIEKPVTLKAEQTEELYDLARKKKKKIFVAFQNRYNPSIKKTKEILDKKSFGKIITVSARLRWCRYDEYYNDDWHGTWKLDGGVLSNQAIHLLDIFLWYFGSVKKVFATSKNIINKLQAEDTIVATIEFNNGVIGTFEATTGCRPKDYEVALSIIGEKGIVEIDGLCLNTIRKWKFSNSTLNEKIIKKNYSENIKMPYGNGHIHLLKDILDNLNKNNLISFHSKKEMLMPIELMHAFYKSALTFKPIDLKTKPKFKKLGN